MTDYFHEALELVLREEGGKVDNPKDPGGRTAYGITQRSYDDWNVAIHEPLKDVYYITYAEVRAIYYNKYAKPLYFDGLPHGVGYCVFDDAVNSGVVETIKDLQRTVGATPDGVMGELTLNKVLLTDELSKMIDALCDRRLTFLRQLKAYFTFGKGWTNRVEFVRKNAKAMLAVKA